MTLRGSTETRSLDRGALDSASRRRKTLPVELAILVVGIVSTCGTADAAVSARSDRRGTITWPDPATHGPNAVLVQVTGGVGITGVVPRPSLTVYRDRTILSVVGSPYVPDPEFQVSRLSRAGIATLVEQLTAAGFATDALPEPDRVPDGGPTSVDVRLGGRKYRSSVGSGTPRKASLLLKRLGNLRALVGAKHIVAGAVMRSPQLFVRPYRRPDLAPGIDTEARPWPFADVDISGGRCVIVSGESSERVRAALTPTSGGAQRRSWRVGDGDYAVDGIAVLPGSPRGALQCPTRIES